MGFTLRMAVCQRCVAREKIFAFDERVEPLLFRLSNHQNPRERLDMSNKVAIVGGGWYGCHIASSMLALGFAVKLFERNERLLSESSGNNQFRLHLGFHYPRHAGTRIQSRDGFSRFLERYKDLSRPVNENIYTVPKLSSLLDFDTYKLIMTSTGIPYRVVDRCSIDLHNVEGMMACDERVILLEKARFYFETHLGGIVSMSTPVEKIEDTGRQVRVNGENFDYLVDATWGHLSAPSIETFYEPTILLYFEGVKDLPAITFVDGALYSIYPTEDSCIYTLSSVPFTPHGRYKTAEAARHAVNSIDSSIVLRKLEQMTCQAKENVASFHDRFRFLGPQFSIKTKPIGSSDDRSCHVGRRGRIFTVMSGKIDTIFFATERILSSIEAEFDKTPAEIETSLMQNIRRTTDVLGIVGIK